MKNIFKFLGIVLVAGSLMVACEKDKEENTTNNTDTTTKQDSTKPDPVDPNPTPDPTVDTMPQGTITMSFNDADLTITGPADSLASVYVYNDSTKYMWVNFMPKGTRRVPQAYLVAFMIDCDAQHYYSSSLRYTHHEAETNDPDEYDIIQWGSRIKGQCESGQQMVMLSYVSAMDQDHYNFYANDPDATPDWWILEAKYTDATFDMTTLRGTFTIEATMIDITSVYGDNDALFLVDDLPQAPLKIVANNYKFFREN